MKKAPSRAINLKFLRIPLITSAFFLSILLCVQLCKNIKIPALDKESIGIILQTNNAIRPPEKASGVFLFLKKAEDTPSLKEDTSFFSAENQKEQKSDIINKTVAPQNDNLDVKISNSTNTSIDINSYLSPSAAFLSDNFSVLILHTHTTESYTPSEKYMYTPSDTDRTRDDNFNVVRVGKEIKNVLTQNGINVYHDTTTNDYPSYNGSYNRSSLCAENFIKKDPSIKIILDIHRDAIVSSSGEKVKYTTKIDGEDAACVMLVAGSNISGLEHNNWAENLRFAAQAQKHIQSVYPNLMRPINFRKERFNQHLAPGAIIVEVGSSANTLDEALLGARCFAKALSDFLNSYS